MSLYTRFLEKSLSAQKSPFKSPTRSESVDNEIEDLDEALPPIYFASKKKGTSADDVAKPTSLLGTPIDRRVVTYRPLHVSSNRVFKTDCFVDIQDFLTDGCGLWKGTGTKTFLRLENRTMGR